MSVFEKLLKSAENEYATKVIDGIPAGDVDTYIDTGSYAFNALLSGSIHGGIPNNKITAIAGEEATGKTFFTLGIVKSFLDENKDAGVFYFESEGALTKDLLEQRNVDTNRVWILPVTTIQEFRQQDRYAASWSPNRPWGNRLAKLIKEAGISNEDKAKTVLNVMEIDQSAYFRIG